MECSGHFRYAGLDSSGYGLILANMETERYLRLGGESETSAVYNKKRIRREFVKDRHNDAAITFEVEILREDTTPLSTVEQRAIVKWLFYSQSFRQLFFTDWPEENSEAVNGETKALYLNCRFIDPEKIESGEGVVGYRATLEADGPTAWQEEVSVNFTPGTGEDAVMSVVTDTDLKEYLYPVVTIQVGSEGGDITLFNRTDDPLRLTKFTDVPPETEIIMKGEIGYISGQNRLLFSEKNFIRLLDGENRIPIDGDVSCVTVRWHNRRSL